VERRLLGQRLTHAGAETARPLFVTRRLRMHLGIYISITESTIRIDELARAVEARGFESL
jgi:hypothetical protein